MTTSSVLSGIRVLDCSIAMAGPFAAQRLGDLGADHLDRYEATPAPDVPVVDMTLSMLETP